MKLYVRAQSKKRLNDRLASGDLVIGTHYSVHGISEHKLDDSLEDGTVIAIFDKTVGGNPYTTTWGTWRARTRRVV